eukprot:6984114-Prymnesium_polylepis.1
MIHAHTHTQSPTDQGILAGLSRWGTAPSCVSGSIIEFRKKAHAHGCACPSCCGARAPRRLAVTSS